MKKCPYCAEDIQEEAVKCKHCGSDLAITNYNSRNSVSLKKMIVAVIGIIAVLALSYGIFISFQKHVKNEITNVVKNHYGYTTDKYSFELKNNNSQKAALTVTANNENISWDIKCVKSSGKWEIASEQTSLDSKDLDELKSALFVDKELFRMLIKRYGLKYPNSQLKEKIEKLL